MKTRRNFIMVVSISALTLWAAMSMAEDLVMPPQTIYGPDPIVYDSEAGIVLDAVVFGSGANVTAKSYNVILKPGTTIEAGARFAIQIKEDDIDNDGMSDRCEMRYFENLTQDPGNDNDGDGLNNGLECQLGINPLLKDTDGDGMTDDWEVLYGTNASDDGDNTDDPDLDDLLNHDEFRNGTDPNNPDSDGDGMIDGYEVNCGLDPLQNDAQEDTDGDGILNIDEFWMGSDAGDPAGRPAIYEYIFDGNGNLESMHQQ